MIITELNRPEPFSHHERAALDLVSKGNDPRTGSVFVAMLQQGWTPLRNGKLNTGYFSVVYTHTGKPYVIKINYRFDRAFAEYMILTRIHPNVHFPRFLDAKKLEYDSNVTFSNGKLHNYKNVYAYKIEKLSPLSPNEMSMTESQIIRGAMVYMSHYKLPTIQSAFVLLLELIKDGTLVKPSWKPYLKKVSTLIYDNPSFSQALEILAKHRRGNLDIGPRNFAKRDDGTLVITDPFAFYDKKDEQDAA